LEERTIPIALWEKGGTPRGGGEFRGKASKIDRRGVFTRYQRSRKEVFASTEGLQFREEEK